jgi:hypothetical protein
VIRSFIQAPYTIRSFSVCTLLFQPQALCLYLELQEVPSLPLSLLSPAIHISSRTVLFKMKTTHQAYALLMALVVPGRVSASHTNRPHLVEVYMSNGEEIPYVPGLTLQAASSTAQLSSTTAATSSTASASPAQVQVEKRAAVPDQPTTTASAPPVSHTLVASTAITQVLQSESAQAVDAPTATAQATQITEAPVTNVTGGVMTIAITNNWPSPLSISYLNNEGSPSAIGAPQGAPLGTKTTVVYPTGWAGRIYVGNTINSADSKIEGSTTGANDIDISYVDGFSVPITCSAEGTPITGCNINLWAVSGLCVNGVGDENVCLNPMQGVANGPADPWFLPCQGAAYTFPNDNVANDGDTGTPNISCCIGTAAQGCAAPARQGHGNNQASKAKRSFSEDLKAGTPSLLPRAHGHLKRHLGKARSHGHL